MWPELTDKALVLGDEVTTFADLLLLGTATGLVEEAKASTRRGVWALEQTDLALPREEVLEEAVVFRRARRLESGQDLRDWLASRQLTIDEWEAHLRRCRAGRALPFSAVPAETLELDLGCRAFVVDLACGGWWRRFADLATRLWAAGKLVGNDLEIADSDVREETSRIMAAFETLSAFGESWCTKGLRRVRARERALEETTHRCATPGAIAARILEHATEWTELRFDELLLRTREAANEALLCARGRRHQCSGSRLTCGGATTAALLPSRFAPGRDRLASRRRPA